MIITAIDTNIYDQPEFVEGRDVIGVRFEDLVLDKRIQRVALSGGEELGLRLNHGHPILREGDVLKADDKTVFVVEIIPTDVLVITPSDIHQMGFVAHSLGNRHLPAQFSKPRELTEKAAMIVQYDHTVVSFLDEHSIEYQRTELVPPIPFRHSGHTH
ncbi:urease accessory protein UreE [Corynebacterium glutamicum]|uniref:urease accessory protein UreE n=1 Tax=Corynebacterium glutamicum TaxID=1718 RepID=UPI00117DE589|nr:urease accessory protein UreE [Corynebacterium glutamicum]QDQ19710.1 urease accessory protein UreE [Corynebacterium glutamicum]QDQ23277.1 urease accessory protein UreE [Corynebacterium glutamicum]